ncbi:hypothetical protein K491DRAFT_721701 [Lophiostoma macrostomum CBS 122681]|uniref:Uncharacterized protein n=1 Tax=Lophiostoma macrostomum CBS 122681 TaxID=1314788 RepID=A0A6A6SND3_9PLEO|nr:hypothetical protein K491DRAFT_721701 [Lophiostoma macrostomum CBS 122681]
MDFPAANTPNFLVFGAPLTPSSGAYYGHRGMQYRGSGSRSRAYGPRYFGAEVGGEEADADEVEMDDALSDLEWGVPDFGEYGIGERGLRLVEDLEDGDGDGDEMSEVGGYAETIFDVEELEGDGDELGGGMGTDCEPVFDDGDGEDEEVSESESFQNPPYISRRDFDNNRTYNNHTSPYAPRDQRSDGPIPIYHESISVLAANGFLVPGSFPSPSNSNMEDIAARQEELETKERELDRREHALQLGQRQLQAGRAQLEHLARQLDAKTQQLRNMQLGLQDRWRVSGQDSEGGYGGGGGRGPLGRYGAYGPYGASRVGASGGMAEREDMEPWVRDRGVRRERWEEEEDREGWQRRGSL